MKKRFFFIASSSILLPIAFSISASAKINQEFSNEIREFIKHEIEKEENLNLDNIILKKLKTVSDKELILVQKENNKGLYIFDPISKVFLEKTPLVEVDTNFDELYYFGPFQYYKKINNEFIHLITYQKIKNINNFQYLKKEFDNLLNEIREHSLIENNVNRENIGLRYYNDNGSGRRLKNTYKFGSSKIKNETLINGFEILQKAKFPRNIYGTCTYTVTTLMLYWWHVKTWGKFNLIDKKFLNEKNELITTSYTLQDELLKIGKSLGYGNGLWPHQLTKIFYKYLKDRNLFYKSYAKWEPETKWLDFYIDYGMPVLASGSFFLNPIKEGETEDKDQGEKGLHSVLIYGYNNKHLIAHYGWLNHEKTYILPELLMETCILK
ncbi:Uncharacterised protein [Mycoplasmopsis columbina]|nr:hypothetical protein [Mycoplasmopsis columbina]VEU76869.1 Uncharacterised protein [Mycoplasmopsis columbina]